MTVGCFEFEYVYENGHPHLNLILFITLSLSCPWRICPIKTILRKNFVGKNGWMYLALQYKHTLEHF